MGNIWVKEFTGGLDTRRMPETTAGGVLLKAVNGHITRGGEFEKRAAFVTEYDLPEGTVGLAANRTNLYVFGHTVAPVGLPPDISYQRLQHQDGVTALTRILSFDLNAGKIYAVGEFADGAIFHFYDGVRVTDWYDGRARASFDVIGGTVVPAVAASGSFEVTGGTANIANQITAVTINGVNLIAAAVTHTGNNSTTASAVASAINSHNSTPDYTASANGQLVTITAVNPGPTPNGFAIVRTVTGDFTTGNATNMAGGANAVTSTLNDLLVNGVSVIGAPVLWATSHEATAAAIASAVNAETSSPEYTATAAGTRVSIVAALAGTAANGRAVTFDLQDGFQVVPEVGLVLTGGSDATETYQPGPFVKTIGSKEYAVSGPNMHFSGIKQPTKWVNATGAGFIDMSSETSGAEELIALGEYQNLVAVFAASVILTWFVDPDPALNRKTQVLKNTGTISPRSVTQFGDSDLFYLDESGIRSLKARDSSNAAATADVGVLIDPLIVDTLTGLTIDERRDVIGLIEPKTGNFWLIIKGVIFVFAFYPGAKVSAWSTYTPSYIDVNDETVGFEVEEALVFQRRVFVRSGNKIFSYGGTGALPTYDATIAEAWLPYLNANQPAKKKTWTALDAALTGEWDTFVAMDPTNTATEDNLAILFQTTFDDDRVAPSIGESTHISVRFRSVNDGAAKLSSVVIHYDGDGDED
jgi:hypothetical protein